MSDMAVLWEQRQGKKDWLTGFIFVLSKSAAFLEHLLREALDWLLGSQRWRRWSLPQGTRYHASHKQRADACAHLWKYLVSETCPGSRQAARRALIQSGGKSRKVPGGGEAWSFSSEQDYRLAKYIRWGKGILCRGNVTRESVVMRQLDQVHHPMACVLGARGNSVWRGTSRMLGIAKDWSFYPDMEGI